LGKVWTHVELMADEARGGNVVAATANLVLFSTLSWLLDSRHRDDVEELENSDPLSSRTRQKFHSGQKFGGYKLGTRNNWADCKL
jgi:hypothetical protein